MNSTQSFGFYEDLKNFSLRITQKSNNQVALCYQLRNSLQIKPDVKIVGDNILFITFSHQYGEITSFTVEYQKKNPSEEMESKTVNAAVACINPNIAFHQDVKTINSTQIQLNSLNYYSVNHYFQINKEKDSFQVNFSVDSPYQTTIYFYTFYFGQFNTLPIRFQQQQMDVIVKHEQEDENLKRLTQSPQNPHHQNDEVLSTKSQSPQQEEINIVNFSLTNTTTPTTTTTTQLRAIQDQMKIEDNQESSSVQKTRQRKASKISSSSNFNNNGDESQSTEFQNNKKNRFDKKNVVKNFVKAFDSYFLDPHNDQQIMAISHVDNREQLKKYRFAYEKLEKSMKYNNKMIIAIIYSEFKDIFQFFLETEADKWILQSSVFDKEAHRAILKDYIRAAENPRDIPKIVNLRIRNREANGKLCL